MSDTEAKLAEPRAKGDSANAAPGQGSAPAEAPAAEPEKKGEVKDRGSKILRALTAEQYQTWKASGELPEGVSTEEPVRSVGENEKLLAGMTPEERRHWRETGEIAERILNLPEKTAAKEASGPEAGDEDFRTFAGTTTSPLARVHAAHLVGKDGQVRIIQGQEAEADRCAREAIAGEANRIKADRESFSAYEQERTTAAWKAIAPKLPEALLNFLGNTVQPLLHAPFTFYHEFLTNQTFRNDVLRAMYGEGGSVDKMVKVIARFDAKQAPTRQKLRVPPSPAASVGGKGTAPVDEERAALEQGDFRRYLREANRRDHLRKVGTRG